MKIDSNFLMSISENKHFSSEKGLLCAQNMLKSIGQGINLISPEISPSSFLFENAINAAKVGFIPTLIFMPTSWLINLGFQNLRKILKHKEDGIGLENIIENNEKMIVDLNAVKKKIYELLDVKVACAVEQYLISENALPPSPELSNENKNVQTRSENDITKELKKELKNAQIQRLWEWEEIEKDDYKNDK